MSNHTRRSFLAAAAAALGIEATGIADKLLPSRLSRVITAGDPGANKLVVYNKDTGEEMHLVRAVCVGEGWIEQYRHVVDANGGLHLADNGYGELLFDRIFGPWAIRPGSLRRKDHNRMAMTYSDKDALQANLHARRDGWSEKVDVDPMPAPPAIFTPVPGRSKSAASGKQLLPGVTSLPL